MWSQKGKRITCDWFLYEEEKGLDHVIHPQVTFVECTCSNGRDGTNESSTFAKDQRPSFVATDKEQLN